EPAPKLTMGTFDCGGAVWRAWAADSVPGKTNGAVRLQNMKTVTRDSGNLVAVSRSGAIAVADGHGRERELYKLPYGAVISVQDGAKVQAGQKVASWDPNTHPIVAEVKGRIEFVGMEEGITIN